MKLKFYLRGIGVGILFSVLVFSFIVIPQLERTYTAKIEALEKELDKKNNIDISALKASGTPVPTPTLVPDTPTPTVDVSPTAKASPEATPTGFITLTGTPKPSPSSSPTPTSTPKPTLTVTPKPTSTPKPTLTVTPKPTSTPKPTLTATPKPTPSNTPKPSNTPIPVQQSVTFEIKLGMSSETVANILYEKGLIDKASSFNTYLIANGYETRITVGTFTINVGADYKEIAEKIIGKR